MLARKWMQSYRTSASLNFQDTDFATRGRQSNRISSEEMSTLLEGVSARGESTNTYRSESSSKVRSSDGAYGRSNSSRFAGGRNDEESFSSRPPRTDRAERSDRWGDDSGESGASSSSGYAPRRYEGGGNNRFGGDRAPRSDRFNDRPPRFGGGDRGDRPSRFGGSGGGGGGRFGDRDGPASRLRSVNFTEENLPPVNKNFYRESDEVKAMTDAEISAWRGQQTMEILGDGCPRPIFNFDQTAFPPFIKKHLYKLFPSGPSPIQAQGWPLSSTGRDLIASAQTGSGKTIAFVLPALEHIMGQPKLEAGAPGADQPVALFLAPTRELAMQIHEETKRFSSFYGFRTACVYGGQQNRLEQTRQLIAKPQIIIATPGRLLDFVESKLLNLARISYVVLDEADRMLDMGFEPQVRAVLGQIRPDRQTLMWSATWPKKVQELANQFLKSPIRIRIGSDELSANPNVKQEFVFCNWNERLERLTDILKERKGQKILIFTSTKMNAELLTDELYDHGHRVQALHGDKQQSARTRILSDFKTGRAHVLIATDVAARGIDVSDIQCVINYNMPGNSEDYVHRIGRTGRAGKTGTSVSFFSEDDETLIPELIPILTESQQEVPTEFTEFMVARRAKRYEMLRSNGPPRRGGSRGPSRSGGGFRGGARRR